MKAIFIIVDQCLRFTFNGGFSVFFYLVAHNFYDVLLILLAPPYIDFSQLSALSVFKNAS